MTIFTQHFFYFLSKIFSTFFSVGIVILVYWFIFTFLFNYFYTINGKKNLKSLYIKLQPTLLLRISHLFLLHNFKTLLKNFKFDCAFDIWLDYITFDMFYILGSDLIMIMFYIPFFFILNCIFVEFY